MKIKIVAIGIGIFLLFFAGILILLSLSQKSSPTPAPVPFVPTPTAVSVPLSKAPTPLPTEEAASSSAAVPDSPRIPDVDKNAEDFNKTNHPDVYVANKTPYETTDFSVTSRFVPGYPEGHYGFSVTQNTANAQKAFVAWLHSLGLSDEMINTLDIIYN